MLSIIPADFNNKIHQTAFLNLINHYAIDPMGGGQPLSEYSKAHLIENFQNRPALLCFVF